MDKTQFYSWIMATNYTINHFVGHRVELLYGEYKEWAYQHQKKLIKLDTFRRQAVDYFPQLVTRKGVYQLNY